MKTIISIVFLGLLVNSIFSQTANEIIYYNFEPDTFAYAKRHIGGGFDIIDSLRLDVNNDHSNDVMFYYAYSGPISVLPRIVTLNENWQICLTEKDSISSYYNNWSNSIGWYANPTDSIGVRFTQGADYYYGWIRAYTTSNDTAIFIAVDKMAFCTIPNYPLLWGQTDVNAVPGETANNKNLVLVNNNNKLSITANEQIVSIEIFNSKGESISNMPNINSDTAETDISALAAGMYIVRASFANGGTATAKFVKQ